ncbi:restriction endonuclease subunit S [uncultured Psychroserpens sp.]|uniref:restriction endonuclease subunit S n=1 Tax=uncultured Psychroserpens sp. TaxID=255436 RepID=UPI002637C065|nr:restriction endonuclease subunit S [uncultured Psychroserpens sp.]
MNQLKLLSDVIPSDWKIETLDKLTETIFVGTDPVGGKESHSLIKTDYRIIQSSPIFDGFLDVSKVGYIDEEIYNSLISVSLKDSDVLLNQLGNGVTFARSCIVPRKMLPAIITRSVGCIRCNSEKLDPWFLNAFLILPSTKKYIESFDSGSSRRAIDGSKMRQFLIPHPKKIDVQKSIGKFYKTILDKIEVNNKINGELEAMAKLIYDYWFVQFDFPFDFAQVKPSANGKPYKSSGGKMIFNEELKREIPNGWDVKELKSIAECIMGQSPKGSSYNQDGIGMPLLNGPADYENGALKGRTYTTEPKRTCQKDDLVLCIRATIGNLVYSEQEFCLGRGVAAVRPNDSKMSELIHYYLLQEIERFKIQATGSIIRGITKSDLTDSKCFIPHDELIQSFHNKVKPMFDNIRVNKKENQKLAELRDWLLPMLMNGQVTVGEAKEQLGMVAEEGEKYQ